MKVINKENFIELVKDWTRKAQNSSCNDDERNIYYKCAEDLHDVIFFTFGQE